MIINLRQVIMEDQVVLAAARPFRTLLQELVGQEILHQYHHRKVILVEMLQELQEEIRVTEVEEVLEVQELLLLLQQQEMEGLEQHLLFQEHQ